MMLIVKKGPMSYKDLKEVNSFQHKTFRESCFAMKFLQDDKYCIEAIKETHIWSYDVFLRKLFITMLLSSSMNRLKHV